MLNSPYRGATPQDALAMAELVNIAGEGMPLYLWTQMAGERESPWQIGQQRAQRVSGGFSYRNTVVHEDGDSVVAALIGYPLQDQPEPANYDEMPETFVTFKHLAEKVPGTWYINVLATYADHRGKGYGTGLLGVAELMAAQQKCNGLSLIVSDANPKARRLYSRSGYQEVASRPMVKESWENAGENWILLRKALSAGKGSRT